MLNLVCVLYIIYYFITCAALCCLEGKNVTEWLAHYWNTRNLFRKLYTIIFFVLTLPSVVSVLICRRISMFIAWIYKLGEAGG